MDRWTASFCRRCERDERECGRLSRKGYCEECGPAAHIEAVEQMRDHRGPAFDTWRERMAASIGVELPRKGA